MDVALSVSARDHVALRAGALEQHVQLGVAGAALLRGSKMPLAILSTRSWIFSMQVRLLFDERFDEADHDARAGLAASHPRARRADRNVGNALRVGIAHGDERVAGQDERERRSGERLLRRCCAAMKPVM